MAVVKLSSQEGEEFEVPVDIAKLSETVKHIMEGKKKIIHRSFSFHCHSLLSFLNT